MSEKFGEGVIQSAFVEHLRERWNRSQESGKPYVSANFQGLADKTFADYFASTSSICALIEFKEYEKEFKSEDDKVLRNDLCSLLAQDVYEIEECLAAKGHFIAWGNADNSSIQSIESYPKKVCPLFGIDFDFKGALFTEKKFIEGFLESRVGLSIREMNQYVQLLARVAQQGDDNPCPKFRAFLLSFDEDTQDFIKQPFENLCQLQEIMEMAMKKLHKPGFTPSGGG
jgi:hypothetical protein